MGFFVSEVHGWRSARVSEDIIQKLTAEPPTSDVGYLGLILPAGGELIDPVDIIDPHMPRSIVRPIREHHTLPHKST